MPKRNTPAARRSSRTKEQTTIHDLPNEILLQIFNHVPAPYHILGDKYVGLVSKRFNAIAHDQTLLSKKSTKEIVESCQQDLQTAFDVFLNIKILEKLTKKDILQIAACHLQIAESIIDLHDVGWIGQITHNDIVTLGSSHLKIANCIFNNNAKVAVENLSGFDLAKLGKNHVEIARRILNDANLAEKLDRYNLAHDDRNHVEIEHRPVTIIEECTSFNQHNISEIYRYIVAINDKDHSNLSIFIELPFTNKAFEVIQSTNKTQLNKKLNAQSCLGHTPLSWAISTNINRNVQAILDKTTSNAALTRVITTGRSKGHTHLSLAISRDNSKSVKALLQKCPSLAKKPLTIKNIRFDNHYEYAKHFQAKHNQKARASNRYAGVDLEEQKKILSQLAEIIEPEKIKAPSVLQKRDALPKGSKMPAAKSRKTQKIQSRVIVIDDSSSDSESEIETPTRIFTPALEKNKKAVKQELSSESVSSNDESMETTSSNESSDSSSEDLPKPSKSSWCVIS